RDATYRYQTGQAHTIQEVRTGTGLNNPDRDAAVAEELAKRLGDGLELVQGAAHEFDVEVFLAGELTRGFFGTALGNFGVDHMRKGLVSWAQAHMQRQTD
ncbi:peptide chain release factor 3, partial [Morganella morganii]|nr:peptide chain release factor 3 [Morganella morganii]